MKTPYWYGSIVLLSLLVYVFCLSPSVTFTDAGELAGACYSLGVAHPTGYPLFVLLGFVWTHLPMPLTVIAKMNLFAAVCTAVSAGFVFLLCREVLNLFERGMKQKPADQQKSASKSGSTKAKRSAGLKTAAVVVDTPLEQPTSVARFSLVEIVSATTALSYAFAQTVWAQSNSIEVYSLHLACMSATLWMCVRAVANGQLQTMRFAALLLGLCFTNHLTTILICVPIVVLFFYRPLQGFNAGTVRRKEFLILLGIILSCAVLYATLVINSLNGPWFNWGAVHRGWEQFSYHVFGKQYSVWMFSDEKGVASKQFKVFLSLLGHNTAYVGCVTALLGLVLLWRRTALRPLAAFFSLLVFCGVAYSVNYNIHDIDTYFLSAYTAIIILSAVGLYFLLSLRPQFAVSAFLIPIFLLSLNWKDCDQHENVLVREYVKMMIDPLPKNAVLFSQQWDYFCSAFWYMQQVEGYRPDVVLVEKELLRRTWFPSQLERWYPWAISSSRSEIDRYLTDLADFERDGSAFQEDQMKVHAIQGKYISMLNSFVMKNIDQRPVFATQEVFQGEEGFAKGLNVQPFGLCLHISRDSTLLVMDTTRCNTQAFTSTVRRHHSDHLEIGIASTSVDEFLNSVPSLAQAGFIAEAQWHCKQALSIEPSNRKAVEYLQRLATSLPKPAATEPGHIPSVPPRTSLSVVE